MKYDEIKVFTFKEKDAVRRLTSRCSDRCKTDRDFDNVLLLIDGIEYRLAYKKEDADKMGIEYTHWSKFKAPMAKYPCYVEFECGWVAIVLDWFSAPHSINVITGMGHRVIENNNKNNYDMKPYFDIEKKPVRLFGKSGVNKYTRKALVAGLMALNCNHEQICAYYKGSPEKQLRTNIKSMMRNKEVIKMATEEVKNALADLGITPEYILKGMNKAIDLAEKKGRVDVLVTAWDKLATYAGFYDKDTKTKTNAIEFTSSTTDLQTLQEDIQKVKLVQQQEVKDE